jgi:hypothetical protein
MLGAKRGNETLHRGVKNHNEVPAQYSSVAHKRKTRSRR